MAIKNNKISLLEIFLYFIFIPILYPRGFAEYYPAYKVLFTVWFYLALVMAVLMISVTITKRDFHVKHCFLFLLLNYAFLIGVTFFKLGSISEGVQKLFASPIIMLFCLCLLEKNVLRVVKILSNILIINYILDFICNYVLFRNYFSASDKHLIFLGHIQVASQLGILGLLLSYILYRVMNEKKKSLLLCAFSIISMLLSGTLVSLIIVIMLGICFLIYKLKLGTWIFRLNPTIYLIVITVASGIFLYLSTTPIAGFNIGGNITTFNGRLYIWREGLRILQNNWVTGFGAYGVNIKVFWLQYTGETAGFNYAHSQLLQTLLDGGIIQTGLYFLMWKKYLDNLKYVLDERMKFFGNLFSIFFLLVMIVESVDVYFYVIIFMSLIANLPQLSEAGKERME